VVAGAFNASPDAVAGPGFVDIFALSLQDKSILHGRRTGETWGAWESLGGEFDGPPGAVRLSNGAIHVFGRGTNAAMWHCAFANGEWSEWHPIGGEFNGAVRPAAVDLGGGRLEVFALGKDNHIWFAHFDGTNWSDWNPVNDGLLSSDPAAAVLPSLTQVFALGTDRALWVSNRGPANGNQWSTWAPWDPERFDGGHHPDVAVDGNEFVIAIRGVDGAVRARSNAGWANLGGMIESDPAVVVLQERTAGAKDPAPVAAAPPPSGVYRVTLNGFIVHHETDDGIQELDGARDEIFVEASAAVAGAPQAVPFRALSRTFGDTHLHDWRIQAGSARGAPGVGAMGGFMTGDAFPTRTPWVRNAEPLRFVDDAIELDPLRNGVERLPIVAFEGELVRGRNTAVIVPAIFEEDAGGLPGGWPLIALSAFGLTQEFESRLLGVTPQNAGDVAAAMGASLARQFRYAEGPDAGTRPIGMQLAGNQYVWRTTPIVLTYDIAEALVRRQGEFTESRPGSGGSTQTFTRALPNGVSSITWRDADRLGGEYTLFWQIEKIR
jgi:hypothetical protein